MRTKTIPELLQARCEASPRLPAFLTLTQGKHWQPVTWAEFAQSAALVGAALKEAGVGKGDRVGILAPTSIEWEYAQMGALAAGAIVAGIDPGYPSDQLDQVMRLLDPSVLFVKDHAALARIPPTVRAGIALVVIFDGKPQSASERSMCDLLASTPHNANKMTGSPEPQDPAVMVFSSGTTGLPKAILFSHKQVCDAIEAILDAFDDIEEGTVLLCWLPLANLFQRVINFCAIGRGATSYILSDPRTLMDHIGDVKPHILIGVPRVFERMQTGIVERIEKLPLPLRYLAQGSLLLGRRHAVAKVTGKHPAIASKICWFFVEMLILSRLRAAAFGGRMRYFISGSAAMPLWLLEWFEGLGLPVLEAYGISENIIPISANRFSSRKLGAVGKPVSPTQISLAPDGEILVRGPGVCGGYWRAPAASSERFTLDGFWRSGDVGCLDEEGFLSLLGRKSEAFKTSGGKWVLPMRIEEQLRRVPYISESIVLQLDSGVIASVVNIDRSKLSSPTGGRYKDEDVLDEKFFRHFFAEALQIDLKTVLADLPAYQRPIGVVVTFQQFSIQGGELTTNMKVRRGIVIERFESQLKRLGLDIARASETARSAGSSHVSNPVIVLA